MGSPLELPLDYLKINLFLFEPFQMGSSYWNWRGQEKVIAPDGCQCHVRRIGPQQPHQLQQPRLIT